LTALPFHAMASRNGGVNVMKSAIQRSTPTPLATLYKTNAIKTAFGHHHAKKLVVGSTKDRSNC
jgi:hypothetical protein